MRLTCTRLGCAVAEPLPLATMVVLLPSVMLRSALRSCWSMRIALLRQTTVWLSFTLGWPFSSRTATAWMKVRHSPGEG